MNDKKRTVVIGFGSPEKYGIDRDDATKVYFNRNAENLKDVPLTEIMKTAQRMRPDRIVCEDILQGH